MSLSEAKLEFWAKNRYNVCLAGRHGVGKTGQVKALFNRLYGELGVDWLYFSASTMDPWVDFIGVPKERTAEDGTTYLGLVRPEVFARDQVKAIFLDEYNRCLVGDTRIQMADGNSVAIKDLVGQDEFFVYSYDTINNRVAIGRGHSARLTEKKAKILKITLDNGATIRCTEDHPFLLTTNMYVEAKDLHKNDALMCLYKKYNKNGYEMVSSFRPTKWEFSHHLADQYNLNNEEYDNEVMTLTQQGVVFHRHHKNKDRFNNSPRNISRLTPGEHILEHSKDGGIAAHKKHPNLYHKTLALESSRDKAIKSSIAARTTEEYRQLRSQLSAAHWTAEKKDTQANRAKNAWSSGQFDNIDRVVSNRKARLTYTIKILQQLLIEGEELTEEMYETIRQRNKKNGGHSIYTLSTIKKHFKTFENFVSHYYSIVNSVKNHRVLSVEEDGYEDVYDITVDDYHNFALGAGPFVHNSPKKVRNSVMELIQFGSINGHKFHNLEVVWTAINPPEEDEDNIKYDVDELDPAQLDRFHVYVEVPYSVSRPYFVKKYGADNGAAAVEWWNGLNKQTKDLVSPRRLDYAIDCFVKGGDVRDILNKQVNVSELLYVLSEGSIKDTLRDLIARGDKEAAAAKLQDENFYKLSIQAIMKDKNFIQFFFPLLPDEKFSAFVGSTPKRKVEELLGMFSSSMEIREKVDPIINANSVTPAKVRTLKEWVKKNFATTTLPPVSVDNFEKNFKSMLNRLIKNQAGILENTHDRINSVNELSLYLIATDKAGATDKITKREAKKAYRCLLYFISRSQRGTFGKVSKNWEKAITILNKAVPFDDALYKEIVENEAKAQTNTAKFGFERLQSWGIDLIEDCKATSTNEALKMLGEILENEDDEPPF